LIVTDFGHTHEETDMGNPAGVRAKKREKRRKKYDRRLAAKAAAPAAQAGKK
jgi:hypothetical protein